MEFKIEIHDVRPIRALQFSIDLTRNAPMCIVGKNGTGKTTLAKVIMNFVQADTFSRTASAGVIREGSVVQYELAGGTYKFGFDSSLQTLSSRTPVPSELKELIAVELPLPHGLRFSFFRTLAEVDDQIRPQIETEAYNTPTEIIEFLAEIYGENRFGHLLEVNFKGGACCVYRDGDRYVREDYFSSGEFFLINLYRRLKQGKKLLFIDEIDIALDAAAQARLVPALRRLCTQFEVNVVFTSHSLALMQTLDDKELLYLEVENGISTLTPRSHSFVKSVMFGFKGRDRYILVEDVTARLLVEFLIAKYCSPTFFTHISIVIGGANQVQDLRTRNAADEILGPDASVIAILDGDQAGLKPAQQPQTYCFPISSVETAFTELVRAGIVQQRPSSTTHENALQQGDKAVYKAYIRERVLSADEIIAIVAEQNSPSLEEFAKQRLLPFLCRQP